MIDKIGVITDADLKENKCKIHRIELLISYDELVKREKAEEDAREMVRGFMKSQEGKAWR